VGKSDLLTTRNDTFKENETGFASKNSNGTIESNGTETSASYRKMIKNPLPVDTVKETPVETKYIPIETKNITGTNNSTVEINNSLPHVQGEIVENAGDGKGGTPQLFINSSVKETEVIQNTGENKATYRVAYYRTGYGEGYYYSRPVELEPEQITYIDWPFWSGARPGEHIVTWYLFSYDEEVYQVTTTHIIAEEEG